MSTSITLAHFCDKHGPKSILCTQKVTDLAQVEQFILPEFSKESYCMSCLFTVPPQAGSSGTCGPTTTLRSVDGGSTAYISSQYSSFKFRMLNSVVKKCLSEETMNYDGRPVYFGDDFRGFSVCISFKIRDLEARGSERRYVIIVNSEQERVILRNWDLILGKVGQCVEYIKQASQRVQLAAHEGSDQNNNEIYLRGKVHQPKSLATLVNDDEFFCKLHCWFADVLRVL